MEKNVSRFLELKNMVESCNDQKNNSSETIKSELDDYYIHLESQICWELKSLILELFAKFQKNELDVRTLRSKLIELLDTEMELMNLFESNPLLIYIHFKAKLHPKAEKLAKRLDSLHIYLMDWDWDPDVSSSVSWEEQTKQLENQLNEILVKSFIEIQDLLSDE